MKAFWKIFSVIVFMAGMLLIIGAVGEDDFYLMELQQAHSFNWIQILIGFLMQIPFVIVANREERKHAKRKAI